MTPSLQQDTDTEAAALLLLSNNSNNNNNNQKPAASLPTTAAPTPIPCDDEEDPEECSRASKRAATGGGELDALVTAPEALLLLPDHHGHQEATAVEDLNESRASVVSLSSRSTAAPRGSVGFDEFPATEEEARVQLEVVFSLEEWCDMGDQEHVLETLSMFPALATERFLDCTGNGFHPLVHLIFTQACLEHIREVLNLWPDVLAMPQGSDQNLPLHIACVYDSYDEVTAFLARAHPMALTKYNGSGMLPLHRVLAKKQFMPCTEKASFALIRFLVGLYPQSVILPATGGLTALDYAFHEGYDIFVLYYILNLLAPVMQQFTVGKSYHGKPVIVDLDKARVLDRILPHTQHLLCEPMGWTGEALHFLMHCLKNNPTATTKVRLKLSQSDMSSECRFVLKQALEMNTNLSQFCLVCPSTEAKTDNSALLASVREGLKQSRSLQVFQLGQFQGQMLDLITAPGPNLTTVEVAQLAFTDVAAAWNPDAAVLQKSRMQSLTIAGCSLHPDCLRKLLEQLALMPALHSLSVDVFGRIFPNEPQETSKSGSGSSNSSEAVKQQYDMTTELVALVAKGKLRSLTLGASPLLQIQPMCEELERNSTMQFLNAPTCFDDQAKEESIVEVLTEHNTTLLQIKTPMSNERIIHYTTLNALGRGKVRDPTILRQTFIDHICSITLINALEGKTKHSIMFGLLRECPKVWSEVGGEGGLSPSSRKRRRSNGLLPRQA